VNIDAIVNVLANVVYLIERKKISVDRAFTLTCRRVKCSTKEFTREDIYTLAHAFINNYYLVKHVVSRIRGDNYSYRMLARAFLYLKLPELGYSVDSKLKKAIKRDLPNLEQVLSDIEEPWIRLSYPKWMYEKLSKVLSREELEMMLRAMNKRNIWIRVNTLRIDVDKAIRELEREEVYVEQDKYIPFLLRVVKSRKPVRNLRLFREGYIVIQDRASVLTVMALRPEPQMLIYDAAAAPGIKTSLIMQLTENRARIIAMDLSIRRLMNMKKLLKKYGVDMDRVHIVLTDSRTVAFSRQADAALVDAPCSSSGAIPKDPAIKILLRNDRIPQRMSLIQVELLRNALRYADIVVFATCSLFPEEGEEVVMKVQSMDSRHRLVDAAIPASRGYRTYPIWHIVNRTYPHIDNCEGFFISRFES